MKAALGFITVAVIAGGLIGATRWLTADRIVANQAAREQAIIADILGAPATRASTSNSSSNSSSNSKVAARLCRTSVRGYAGAIELLVLPALSADGSSNSVQIEAVRVAQHRETPGIGDFITTDNSPWILGFTGLERLQTPRDSSALWQEQLDAVSGATITRRAVIKGVAHACERPL